MKQKLFSIGRFLTALFVASVLGGCATSTYSDGKTAGYCIGLSCPLQAAMGGLDQGRDPASEFTYTKDITLGTTSYWDILRQNPNPNTQGNITINGTQIFSISYVHSDPSELASEPGVTPAHAVTYYFTGHDKRFFGFAKNYGKEIILVGQVYTSSYKSDSTNFDETKVSGIVKGKSTRAEVVQLMGEPSGMTTVPMDNTIEYAYAATRFGATPGTAISKSKSLKVTFAGNDVVADVVYAEK